MTTEIKPTSNTDIADWMEKAPEWQSLVTYVLEQAQHKGVTAAEVDFSMSTGLEVTARSGDVENLTFNRDKGLEITVYFGHKKGSASTTDTRRIAIMQALDAACEHAEFTTEDPFAGLADADKMAKHYPDLDLYHRWNIDAEQALDIALRCEEATRNKNAHLHSDGATVSSSQAYHIYGNSHGFMGAYPTSQHYLSCRLLVEDPETKDRQRDHYYTVARDPADLETAEYVAAEAVKRTLNRLHARGLKTQHAPVLFCPEMARGLWSHFLSAISGGSLYRHASFLCDHLEKSIFPSWLSIQDDPFIRKGLGSVPFDAEGVMPLTRDLIHAGTLQGYLLSSYSARKLGMQTTGNAGGAHNVRVKTNAQGLASLLREMNTGFLVTELMGQGVNIITGDYSRGAAGFWVENGAIQYPVQGVTIAGNLRDMFQRIVAVGNDIDNRSSILTGSVWINEMMIAGE